MGLRKNKSKSLEISLVSLSPSFLGLFPAFLFSVRNLLGIINAGAVLGVIWIINGNVVDLDYLGLLAGLIFYFFGYTFGVCLDRGQSLVSRACISNRITFVRIALNFGYNPNSVDWNGMAPLHHASSHGRSACCRLLLARGADVNLRDYRGDSPLHHAARNLAEDTCFLLLQHGANPDVPGSDRILPEAFLPAHRKDIFSFIQRYRLSKLVDEPMSIEEQEISDFGLTL